MYAKNCEISDLNRALDTVNEKYGDNIEYKSGPEYRGNRILFTLKVKNSRGPGARISPHGRRLPAACWHIHGDFFDALFSINPKAEIKAMQKTINIEGGNWEDSNIGSQVQSMRFSEACNC